MNSPCREHELDALLAGELSPEDAARVRAHAESCAACTHALAWQKLERGWMAQRARRAAPTLDFAALEARLSATPARTTPPRPAPRRNHWAHGGKMALAAAASVAFVLLSLAQPRPRATSEETRDSEAWLFTPMRGEVCEDGSGEAVATVEARVGACLLASPVLAVR